MCVSADRLCDGIYDCPYLDDELLCSTDRGSRSLTISNSSQPFASTQHSMLTYLNLANNNFVPDEESLRGLHNLIRLDLSNNGILVIRPLVFQDLVRLEQIHFDGNNLLERIQTNAFTGLKSLKTLSLTDMRLSTIHPKTFEGLDALVFLNLSTNLISTLMEDAFLGLDSLQVLDLRHNRIQEVSDGVLMALTSLSELSSDVFMLCCLKPDTLSLSNCHPGESDFSSCNDLISSSTARTILWMVGVIGIFGNVLIMVYRILLERQTFTTSNGVLAVNLGVSDFLMGVYVVIIVGNDFRYRGDYIVDDFAWRESQSCTVAGECV